MVILKNMYNARSMYTINKGAQEEKNRGFEEELQNNRRKVSAQ